MIAPMVPRAGGPGAIPMLLHSQLAALSDQHTVTLVVGVGDEPGEREAARALIGAGVDLHPVDRGLPATALARWTRRRRLAWTWLTSGSPWRTVWFAAPAVQAVVDGLAARQRFDVMAVEDSSMALYRLPAGCASVLTEHEVRWPRPADWRVRTPRSALAELDWRRWAGFQRRAWERYTRLQVFTERDAQALSRLAPGLTRRVRVNPFGLELPALLEPAHQEPGRLLFVGNFTHAPNRDGARWLVEEILPRIRSRRPEARLQIVGTSPPPEVISLSRAPGVEVVGDAPSIDPHLEAAAVVVAPLRIGGGMRMKVLLGLASGKAVVSTTRGAEGFLTESGPPPLEVRDDPEAFAVAVAELLADDDRRQELGRLARAYAERHHSPRAWANRLTAVYEEARQEVAGCESSS